MEFKMKDSARYEALCKAIPGFERHFQANCRDQWEKTSDYGFIRVTDSGFWAVSIPKNDVETVPEYDIHAWNRWPDVKPPVGKMLRIELYDRDLTSPARRCGWFDGDQLVGIKGLREDLEIFTRPWDEAQWAEEDWEEAKSQ